MGCGASSKQDASDSSKVLVEDWRDSVSGKEAIVEYIDPFLREGSDVVDWAIINQQLSSFLKAISPRGPFAWESTAECIDVLTKMEQIHAKYTWALENYDVLVQILQIISSIQQASTASRQHVNRVCGAFGWSQVHGLAFELVDGTRLGKFVENDRTERNLLDDAGIKKRDGKWHNFQDGEYVKQVWGHHCTNGYLAHDVHLVTNQRTLDFSPNNDEWCGREFKYDAPAGNQIEQIIFNEGVVEQVRCVPVLAWSVSESDKGDVRSKAKEVAVKALTTLADLGSNFTLAESKYILFLARNLELGALEVVKQLTSVRSLKLPDYWDLSVMDGVKVDEGTGLTFNPADNVNLFGRVVLSEQELKNMQTLFDTSFQKRYTRDRGGAKVPDQLEVVKGVRIQNAMNWAEYCSQNVVIKAELQAQASEYQAKKAVEDKTGFEVGQLKTAGVFPHEPQYLLDDEVQSAWLFHGTSDAASEAITKGDFLINLAGSNAGTLYGRGVYLAESCSKSDEYCQENDERLCCMLVCRATLGNINYNDEKSPPVDALVRSCTHGPRHSVLGDREKCSNTFKEIIVYDDNQAYPEYVIWYRRVYLSE